MDLQGNSMQGYLYYPNQIGDIPVDVILSNSHILSAEVTKNTLENGAKISEHVVLDPAILSVSFQQTNVSGGAERARSVWGQFKQIRDERSLITVVTEHDIYENMIITNLTGLESAPFKGALSCTLTLTQVNFVNLQFVLVPEANLLDWRTELKMFAQLNVLAALPSLPIAGMILATQKTASSAINGGSQGTVSATATKTVTKTFGLEQIKIPTPIADPADVSVN